MVHKEYEAIEKQCKEDIANYLYNMKWLRKHHNLSKKAMAKILDISTSSLNKIENGIMPPRLGIKIIHNIYNSFGILSEEMFTRRFDEKR